MYEYSAIKKRDILYAFNAAALFCHRASFLQLFRINVKIATEFSQICFCQILFELVYSWESYRKSNKGELFIETQCS